MIISILELFRRFLWNMIRLEKEQLTTEGDMKALPVLIFPYEVVME